MMRVLAFAVAVVLVLLPALADNYLLRVATTMLMYSALALAWNFIGGFAGYPSFATAAFFGLGAYASGVLQTKGVPMPAAWALGGAIVAAVRRRARPRHPASARALLRHRKPRGRRGAARDHQLGDRSDRRRHGIEPAGPVAGRDRSGAAVLLRHVRRRRGGARDHRARRPQPAGIWPALHSAERRRRDMLGINTLRYKIVAFVLSAVFPGVCGGIYASWVNYIDPTDVYDVLLSVKPIVMVLLGGVGTVMGGVYRGGPVPADGGTGLAQPPAVPCRPARHHRGVSRAVPAARAARGRMGEAVVAAANRRGGTMTAMLRLINVSRRFGGLIAVNNVSFELRAGEIVGLIGPNGAGKTTLVNLITGVHRAGAGEIRYGERAHRSPAAGSHCPARHRAHVPGRAAVPAHDRAGKRHRRRAVRRRRADHSRGQGKGHGASRVHRAFPPRRAAGIGADAGEPQAPRAGQEPRHQSAASVCWTRSMPGSMRRRSMPRSI